MVANEFRDFEIVYPSHYTMGWATGIKLCA
jgi:hypothetical protein